MVTTAAPLGFNPLSALTTVARGAARVAANPNVQRAATAAAATYAPQQYSQAQQYMTQAQAILRPPGSVRVPMPVPMVMPPPEREPRATGHGMLTLAAIGGGLLLVFLLTR